jgi:uncharacterized protein (TIGR02270 family)
MPIILEIIEQHLDNAAFSWLLRDAAVQWPHYDFADLTYLDERVEANIDGLRIAGDAGWGICAEAMALEEPGEIFTAGVLAFESLNPERMDAMLAAVELDNDLFRSLVSALGWIDFRDVNDPAYRLINAELDFLRHLGLSAFAVQRRDPGPPLFDCLQVGDPALRARSLKAAGELGRLDLLNTVQMSFTDTDGKCRFYAAWSAALLGYRSAVVKLCQMAEEDLQHAFKACDLAARIMDPNESRNWLQGLLAVPERQRLALSGFGALGDPAAIPLIMECMATPELARPAGEAFAMISGVDIAYEDLEGDWPEGFEAGPTESPEDKDVEMDPDENLPWPDPKLIQEWWHKNKSNFRSGVRYLCGKPISEKQCQYVVRHGYQRQRAAAAIELALMKPGTPLFNVKAPGFRQQRLLGMK